MPLNGKDGRLSPRSAVVSPISSYLCTSVILLLIRRSGLLLEELKAGLRIDGLIPAEVVTVIAVQWHGAAALELTYKTTAGNLGQQVVFRKDEDKLSVAQTGSRAFDAPAADFKLVAEAQRITLAGLFDPMLAVATSDVRPLPHQIRAVYGELLYLIKNEAPKWQIAARLQKGISRERPTKIATIFEAGRSGTYSH
jgi:hypothetical protein